MVDSQNKELNHHYHQYHGGEQPNKRQATNYKATVVYSVLE